MEVSETVAQLQQEACPPAVQLRRHRVALGRNHMQLYLRSYAAGGGPLSQVPSEANGLVRSGTQVATPRPMGRSSSFFGCEPLPRPSRG